MRLIPLRAFRSHCCSFAVCSSGRSRLGSWLGLRQFAAVFSCEADSLPNAIGLLRIENADCQTFRFVFTIGIVSLFADMTYDGCAGLIIESCASGCYSRRRNGAPLSVSSIPALESPGSPAAPSWAGRTTSRFQHWLSSLFCYSSPPCRSSFWQRNPRHPNRKPKTDDRQPTTACRSHTPLTLLYTLTVSTGLLSAKSPPTSTRPPHSKHLCTPQKFPRRSYAGSVLER